MEIQLFLPGIGRYHNLLVGPKMDKRENSEKPSHPRASFYLLILVVVFLYLSTPPSIKFNAPSKILICMEALYRTEHRALSFKHTGFSSSRGASSNVLLTVLVIDLGKSAIQLRVVKLQHPTSSADSSDRAPRPVIRETINYKPTAQTSVSPRETLHDGTDLK